MIKFFRKIRHKLLTENKFSKYILYAIGEIVLVVIGILIALQINNWNESRKELKNEQKILMNLNEEFKKNLVELDASIISIDKSLKGMDTVLNVMSNDLKIDRNPEKIDTILRQVITNPTFFPSSIVFKELEASGQLTKLQNAELKSQLFLWNIQMDQMKVVLEISSNSYKDVLDYIKENGSLRRLDFTNNTSTISNQSILSLSNEHLLIDLKFENVVDDHFILLGARKDSYQEAKKIIENIIKLSTSQSNDKIL
jgi:hypothetical protein